MGFCALLILGQVGAGTLAPILLRKVIDGPLPHHQTGRLIVLCCGILACSVFGLTAGIAQSIQITTIGQRVVHQLRVTVYGKVQRMPLTFFATESTADIEARIVSDIGGISAAVTTVQTFLAAAIQLIAGIVVMFVFSWLLGSVSLALGLLGGVLTEGVRRRRRVLAVAVQKQTAQLVNAVAEDLALPGVVLGRTLRRHRWQRARFARLSDQISMLNQRERTQGSGAQLLVGAVFGGMAPLLLILAGTATASLSVGTVVVLITLQARLNAPIQQMISLGATAQASAAMLDRTFEYADLVPDVQPDAKIDAGSLLPTRRQASLSVVGLSFEYPLQDEPALTRVNLELPSTAFTMVVGSSGSGKSSLALLLSGLLRPTSGEIRVNGVVRGPEELWRDVTLVPQQTAMFRSTVRENLLFASPNATDAELLQVIERAALTQVVEQLPLGLDCDVGEGGVALSEGQRQRLGLARALLDRAPVLIADEATSAVDNLTAVRLHETLLEEATRRSVVLIAHRIPDVPDETRVLVIEHGRVVEQDSHARLLADGGRYAELVSLQSLSGIDASRVAPDQAIGRPLAERLSPATTGRRSRLIHPPVPKALRRLLTHDRPGPHR